MSFFQRNRIKVVLAVITLVFIIFIAMSTISGEKSNIFTNTLNIIISPAQKAISSIINSSTEFFVNIANMRHYADKNNELKSRITALEAEARETEDLRKENTRLRNMLELSERDSRYELIASEVIAKDSGNWFNSFTIDKGTKDGLKKNYAVITDAGLVGYIYDVGTTWSKVLTIIDSSCAAGATIKRTGDISIVEGDIALQEKGLCKMTHIQKDTSLKVGDYIETSGLGGVFPEGLYIGKIKEITDDPMGLTKEAVIEPAADFKSIKEVFVMKTDDVQTDETKD